MTRGRGTVIGFCGVHRLRHLRLPPLLETPMRQHVARQRRQPLNLGLIDRAPAVREPEHVDEARPRRNLDQPEMIEQFQRFRNRLPSDVVFCAEVHVTDARAAAVADRPFDRREHPPRAPGQHLIGRWILPICHINLRMPDVYLRSIEPLIAIVVPRVRGSAPAIAALLGRFLPRLGPLVATQAASFGALIWRNSGTQATDFLICFCALSEAGSFTVPGTAIRSLFRLDRKDFSN